MAHPSPTLVGLAQRIVEHEAGGSADPVAAAAAVEAACRRLRDNLVDMLGAGGVSALLRRALHLAQREQPILAGVAVSGEPDACFTGLEEALAADSDGKATAAAATVLAHMLDVLVTLLGKEMGMRPVQKLWPQDTSVKEIDE